MIDYDAKIYAKLNGTWTLLDSLLPYNNKGSWGMGSGDYTDRVADRGILDFTLDNSTGKYDPLLPTCESGWDTAVQVVEKFTFDGKDYVKFPGIVTKIVNTDDEPYDHIKVTVMDWMTY